MCKTCWTSTQRTYGIWWYERGCGKPKWKASMISNDVIHVQVEEGGKNGNVESIDIPKVDDCLSMVHNVWQHAKLAPTMYKQPQSGQGIHELCLWDGCAPGVNTDD